MTQYVLTQEQLDRLQEEIQQLRRIHDAKQERIKELELYKMRATAKKSADLLETIGKMESEIKELKRVNKQLTESSSSKKHEAKIRELETLLEAERKLREYSEAFAKQVELKCAEEILLKDLTTELCDLQKAEIDLRTRRNEELQRKLKNSFPLGTGRIQADKQKEMKQMANSWSRENFLRHDRIRAVTEKMRRQLYDLHEEVERKPNRTKEEEVKFQEVEKWLKEMGNIMADINDIESLRQDLMHIKIEIENKRKSYADNETKAMVHIPC